MSITIDHAGKVAVVTGAGAGIGREIARWLGRAGAMVAVNDVRADRAAAVAAEIVAEGGSAESAVADCRDDTQVAAMIEAVVERHGRLDIAVNNIGMLPAGRTTKAFVEMDGADWRDTVEQNLILAAMCGRAEARSMLALPGSGDDRVILFVSSGETTRPSPFNAAYAAAKAAINHLVTTMAVELGSAGVRVLAIAPGTTATESVRAAYDTARLAAIAASTPLQRATEYDELGRLSVFLASDLARCITGQLILADAGAFLSRTRPANEAAPSASSEDSDGTER